MPTWRRAGTRTGQWKLQAQPAGKVHKRHRDELVGDSPELYRGPDARGLSDLGTLVALNYSLASFHPAGNLLRGKWPMGKV